MLGVCWVIAVSKVGGTRYSLFVFKHYTEKSRTAVNVDVRSCFRHLLLFLLYTAAATAATAIHTAWLVLLGVSFFILTLLRKLYFEVWWWILLYRTPRSNVYEYEKKICTS